MSEFDREPIFWTSTKPGYNAKDRELVRFENGKKVVERVPQRGHQGDYENRRPARGPRAVRMVRHDGHTVHVCVTNAAAHFDSATQWAAYVHAKARFFGWFPVGACPLVALAAHQIQRGHLHEQSLIGQQACEHGTFNEASPCKHALAEIAARRNTRAAETAELARFMDRDERLLEAQRENNQKLGEIIAGAIATSNSAQPPKKMAKDER